MGQASLQVLSRQSFANIAEQYSTGCLISDPTLGTGSTGKTVDLGRSMDSLNRIFPNRQEENRVQQARRIMGQDIADLSDGDLEIFLTEFQYLIDSWLDEYERKVFDNKTLKELLGG